MKTLNDTPLNDNQAIWFVRITDGTNTYRLATESITLDNTWDGNALNTTQARFSLNEVGKRINLIEGGTIGQVASVTFGFKRNASNALLADFFNEFYPATSGKVLSAQKVEVGVGWQGMTADSEITWIQTYSVVNYAYDQSSIYLTCIETLKLDAIILPYYEVQKEADNGVSYTTKIEQGSYGEPIPIVYGDFSVTITNFTEGKPFLVPTVLFDNTKGTVKIASHKCYETVKGNYTTPGDYYILFKSVANGNAYLQMYSTSGAESNTYSGCSNTLVSTAALILGYMIMPLTGLGSLSDIDEVEGATDGNSSTYTDLDCDASGDYRISLRINGNISKSDIGVLSRASAGDINTVWLLSTDGGATRNIRMYFYNNENSPDNIGMQSATTIASATPIEKSGSGYAQDDTGKTGYPVPVGGGTILPYTIEELVNYEYVLENENTTPGEKIRVHGAYVRIKNILVSGSIIKTWSFRFG